MYRKLSIRTCVSGRENTAGERISVCVVVHVLQSLVVLCLKPLDNRLCYIMWSEVFNVPDN